MRSLKDLLMYKTQRMRKKYQGQFTWKKEDEINSQVSINLMNTKMILKNNQNSKINTIFKNSKIKKVLIRFG